jgi:flagellar motor switch protein FliG
VFLDVFERASAAAGERGGQEVAKELLSKALDKNKANQLLERISGKLAAGPFDFLHDVDPAQLVNILMPEHPQTVALVLAHLPPLQASQVIAGLPPSVQADIAQRVAMMNPTTPDVVREVETQLKRKMSSVTTTRHTKVGGIPYLVSVLNNVDQATEKTILETLEEQNPELAEEVRKNLFTFEDIARLTQRDMITLWRHLDMKQVALGLKGASDEIKQKFLGAQSSRNQATLNEEIELLGPTRLAQVYEAQDEIVNVIRRLMQTEDIIVSRGGAEELVY